MKKLAFIGAGSQSDAVYPMVDHFEYKFMGYYDDKDIDVYNEYPVLGKTKDVIRDLESGKINFIFITIGDNAIRRRIYEMVAANHKDKLINIISRTATILKGADIRGHGNFIGHSAFIGSQASIGENCIINTGSVVEHHTHISSHCNIGPNATINGLVTIDIETYIGSGAIIIQGKHITNNVMVGAGTLVIKNIEEPGVYVGVPCRKLGE